MAVGLLGPLSSPVRLLPGVDRQQPTSVRQIKGERAIIYDAKRDTISLLAGMGLYRPNDPTCPVIILNPFDERSAAWDMARDITTKKTAEEIAAILVPDEKNSNQPFFFQAARQLLAGVILAFIHICPGRWQFQDILLALRSRDKLRELFQRCPHTEHLIETFLEAREWSSINSTIATKIGVFEAIAASWAQAKVRISRVAPAFRPPSMTTWSHSRPMRLSRFYASGLKN